MDHDHTWEGENMAVEEGETDYHIREPAQGRQIPMAFGFEKQ